VLPGGTGSSLALGPRRYTQRGHLLSGGCCSGQAEYVNSGPAIPQLDLICRLAQRASSPSSFEPTGGSAVASGSVDATAFASASFVRSPKAGPAGSPPLPFRLSAHQAEPMRAEAAGDACATDPVGHWAEAIRDAREPAENATGLAGGFLRWQATVEAASTTVNAPGLPGRCLCSLLPATEGTDASRRPVAASLTWGRLPNLPHNPEGSKDGRRARIIRNKTVTIHRASL